MRCDKSTSLNPLSIVESNGQIRSTDVPARPPEDSEDPLTEIAGIAEVRRRFGGTANRSHQRRRSVEFRIMTLVAR